MKKLLASIVLAAIFIITSSPLQAGQDCSEILEQNCISCHYKTRICNKIGKKNRRSWKNTTKRMIRYGLKLDKSELNKVTDCLVSLEEDPKTFCN